MKKSVFEAYGKEFKKIFKVDMTNFRIPILYSVGYESFDIIAFDDDFIKSNTEVTGKSIQDVVGEKYGQEGVNLIKAILFGETSK
jgi:hypothetical protein